jgi:hypothetical protein
MAASWDRRPPAQRDRVQADALRSQVVDAVAPFSPWWRARLQALGRTAGQAATREGLAALPAAGERDVCPDGDPSGAAALVLQATERGWALHAEGPRLRAAMSRRLASGGSYAALVEADTRPLSYVWAGLGLRFPVASTRSDLDVVARAGARMFAVLGLTRGDVLVSAMPPAATAAVQALTLGALGAGAPLLAPGPDADDVADALRLVQATVLVLPAGRAAELVDDLDEAGAPLGALATVLLVGAPYEDERDAVHEALERAGAAPTVLAVHVPDGHRLAWAQCRESGGSTGLHTYPDLELVDVVDPETGEAVTGDGPHELVLTQLGLRGSALLRWRTGDLVEAVETTPCPACGRTVPRVVGTARGALVPELALRTGRAAVDLRAVAGALLGRPDVADWRVVVRTSARDGKDLLLVLVVPAGDPSEVVVQVAGAVRTAAGRAPSQVVVVEDGQLPEGGEVLGRRLRVGP